MNEPRRGSVWVLVWSAVATLLLIYAPLLSWLGRATVQTAQLTGGGLLVVFAAAVCLRDLLKEARAEPEIRPQGAGFLLLAAGSLWLATRLKGWSLPLAVLSLTFSFAAVISFTFGRHGVRQFAPALAGFFAFGVLIGLFPQLDWPLRSLSAQQAGGLLAWVGVPVRLAELPGQTPALFLEVRGHVFEVAAECNGFGLLTSSLLLATVLGFQRRLSWIDKIQALLVAVLSALVFNFLRIVAIALVAFHVPISYGVIHEGLGTLFYFAGLTIIWLASGRRNRE